ncbi:MAG: SDR family oxidoreductase [Planctomycetes bacterium]|nr:SDR family oxidoreductase [Planctomycetota bacterium]
MEISRLTAIITGSTGLLGSEIALALANAGCDCICHYNKNKEKAQQLVEKIQKLSVKAIPVQADLTDPDAVKTLFDTASTIGVPRILINSAALFSKEPLQNVTLEKARSVLDLDLIAPILLSKEFAKIIDDNFAGSEDTVAKIINISDVGGIKPWANYVVYCSAKAGLIGATKALAKELAPRILVNSIAPGIVVDFQPNLNDDQKKRQLDFIPMARIGKTKELTNALIFLLQNDYITGQVLNVDGGRCI